MSCQRADIEVYFELDKLINEELFNEIDGCSNETCYNHLEYGNYKKFCDKCGSKIVKVTKKTIGAPCCEKFGEKYFNNKALLSHWKYDERIWFLKKDIKNVNKTEFNLYAVDFLELSNVDFKEELEKYKRDPFIQSILEKFDELYGKDNVKIKIGLFPSYR